MTRLRISANSLFRKRTIYTAHNTSRPENNIICAICPGSKVHVQGELHFMTECFVHSAESVEREQVYKHIIDMCPNFETLQPKQNFNFMLTSDDEIVRLVAKFIANSLP